MKITFSIGTKPGDIPCHVSGGIVAPMEALDPNDRVDVMADVGEYAAFATTFNLPPMEALHRAIAEGDDAVRRLLDEHYNRLDMTESQAAFKVTGFLSFTRDRNRRPRGIRFDFAGGNSMFVHDLSDDDFAAEVDYYSKVAFQFTREVASSVEFLKAYPEPEMSIVEYVESHKFDRWNEKKEVKVLSEVINLLNAMLNVPAVTAG